MAPPRRRDRLTFGAAWLKPERCDEAEAPLCSNALRPPAPKGGPALAARHCFEGGGAGAGAVRRAELQTTCPFQDVPNYSIDVLQVGFFSLH